MVVGSAGSPCGSSGWQQWCDGSGRQQWCNAAAHAQGSCGLHNCPHKPPPADCFQLQQGVAYALYVVSNNFLYNATRLATLVVGGSLALAGAVTAEQLTAFCFYAEFLASALLSVCDQWGPIMEVR